MVKKCSLAMTFVVLCGACSATDRQIERGAIGAADALCRFLGGTIDNPAVTMACDIEGALSPIATALTKVRFMPKGAAADAGARAVAAAPSGDAGAKRMAAMPGVADGPSPVQPIVIECSAAAAPPR